MQKKYFTLEEAQDLIPIVKPVLVRLVRLNSTLSLLDTVEVELEDEYQDLVSNTRMSRRFHKLSYDFYRLLEKILDMGIIVKDLNNGVIDFYSTYDGREILLCYEMNENEICYWHEMYDGYDDRKPISLLKSRIKSKS